MNEQQSSEHTFTMHGRQPRTGHLKHYPNGPYKPQDVEQRPPPCERYRPSFEAAGAERVTVGERYGSEPLMLLTLESETENTHVHQYGCTPNPHRNAHSRANATCTEADELHSLPINDATRRI